MNWDAIGAIAEAAGAVAIFVSLIYVAIQIRQNSREIARSVKAAELSAFERNVESGNAIREMLLVNADLADLYLKGTQSYRQLDARERFRFGMLMRNLFSAVQGAFIRQTTVRNEPGDLASISRIIDPLLAGAGVREWLESSDPDWRPEFRAFVEQRLVRSQQATDHAAPAGASRRES